MFNFFKKLGAKFGSKKEEAASYTEAEKHILSSIFTPMEPTPQFKASLKERALALLSREKTSSSFSFGKVLGFAGTFLALGLLVLGAFSLFDKNVFNTDIPIVRADTTSVPVNFPVRVHFPYENISAEELNKNFTITPKSEGTVSLEKGLLTFTHPKSLQYKTHYVMQVDKATSSKMKEDFVFDFTTRQQYQSQFYLSSNIDFAHYTMNFYDEEPAVFLTIPNGGSYTVKIYSVTPENLMAYVSEPDLKKAYDALKKKMKIVKTDKIDISAADKEGSVAYTYKPGLPNTGLYFVEFIGKKVSEYDSGTYTFFLTHSRYAMSTKRLGKDLVTWLVDMQTGKAVEGAKIKVYSSQKVLSEGVTNGEGIYKQSIDIEAPSKPNLMIVDVGGERIVNLLTVKYRTIYDVDWNNPEKIPYKGYVFTDRPLYSPGDSINFKATLRKANEVTYQGNIKNVRLEISRDEYGSPLETIFEKEYSLNGMGSLAGEFTLPKELKTGEYGVRIKIGGKEIAQKIVGVEVYQKPEFEVIVTPEKKVYIAGQQVKVNIDGKYFFGTPVKGQKVIVTIGDYYQGISETVNGTLDDNGHFTAVFDKLVVPTAQYWWNPEEGTPLTITAELTEDTGKKFSQSTIINAYPSEYRVAIEEPKQLWNIKPRTQTPFVFRVKRNLVEGELNGVEGAKINLRLKQRDWNNYYEDRKNADASLKEITLTTDSFGKANFDYTFEKGGSYFMEFDLTDSKGNKIERTEYLWIPDAEYGFYYDQNQSGTLQVMLLADKENYSVGETAKLTAYVPQEEGDVFFSINTTSMRRVWSDKLASGEYTFDVPITEDLVPGFFVFAEVYSGDSFFKGTKMIEVSGKKMSVEVKASKSQLYPKEKVTVSIFTKDEAGNPIASEGVISVVDKALLALRNPTDINMFDSFYTQPNENLLMTFSTADPYVVGAGEKGGCFLSGTLILMADGTSKPIEEVVVGDKILTKESDFSSRLVTDTVVRTFKHIVGEYLIVNGDLNVTGVHRMFINDEWKTASEMRVGDWLVTEDGERVKVSSIQKVFNRVQVYNFETENLHTYFANGFYVHNDKGGGDARPRSKFVDTAYWNAFVSTNTSGKGSVSFELPDNLTTWVALGKNITKDTKVGEGQGEFVVTKDLFIRPNLPLFFRDGDEAEVLSTVHNNTLQPMTVKALIKPTGATVLNESLQEILLPAQSAKNIVWRIRVNSAKKAHFEFSVNQVGGNLIDNLERTLPIYSSKSLNSGVITGSSPTEQTFAFDKGASLFNSATLTLSSSTLALIPEIMEKLTGYPYGCVEQTMSKHLPNILAKKYHAVLGITLPSDIDASIKDGFDRLQKMQHTDGGFGWWEDDENNLWMTGYVLEGLLEIKDEGLLSGREPMYQKTVDYLSTEFPKLSDNEKIYAAYVLSRAAPGKFPPLMLNDSELTALSPQNLGYIALTAHFNGDKATAKKIMNTYVLPKMQNNHWEQEMDYSSMMDRYSATGVNLSAMLKIGVGDEKTIKDIVAWLMNNRGGYEGLWGSTRESSEILRALIEYIQVYDEFNPDFTYSVLVNGKEISKGTVKDAKFNKKIMLDQKTLKDTNTIQFTHTGKGTLFYSLGLKNYVPSAQIQRVDNGPKVTRTYTTLDGKPITEFKVGDTVMVRIDVESPRDLAYVMVEDMLPEGFDVINDRLSSTDRYYGYEGYYWHDPVDIRDEKVTMFFQKLYSGKQSMTYRARVARKGKHMAPATRVEPMYDPAFYGVGTETIIEVK